MRGCAVLVLAGTLVAQATPPREPQAYLWFAAADATPARLAGAARLGFEAINAEGPVAAQRARAHGLAHYADQMLSRGWLHLPPPGEASGVGRREPCLRDPVTRAAGDRRLGQRLSLWPDTPAFVSLADEPSATRFTNPVVWC